MKLSLDPLHLSSYFSSTLRDQTGARMIVLFVLLLHLTEIASHHQCPNRGAITKNDLKDVRFVAKIRVERVGESVRCNMNYNGHEVKYPVFYSSADTLDYTKRNAPKIVAIHKKCPTLKQGKFYVLGCRGYDTYDCAFVKEFGNVTKSEEKLIKLKGATAGYNFLEWSAL
ncbi:hypothetical protein ANCCAN_11628 [Ancylostoma caninum]|uniref:Uncharacterized protein n=1 Tax=Ancylostoma caninum TaxID=29170 RepID=A0A368GDA2_ANCCA|nr:hypothetical protein ANCCAN_11628 [Ancylostoma caninum]